MNNNNDDKKYSMLSAGMITGSLSAVLLLTMGIPFIITLGVAGIIGITCAPLLADTILQDKALNNAVRKDDSEKAHEDTTDYSTAFMNDDQSSDETIVK